MDTASAVRIEGLRVRYGKQVALSSLNVDLAGGQIVGVLGPSGSGKTTLVKAILGLHNAQEGKIALFGRPVPSFEAMGLVGYMAQNDALYDELTAREHLLFFGKILGLRASAAKERAEELLAFVDLGKENRKPVRYFSGGMRRRLSLAIALVSKPALLILDEPTVGIDPLLRIRFWNEFDKLKTAGCTILATTHVMDEAARCDRLLLIREGRLIANGTLRELLSAAGEETLEGAFLRFGTANGKAVL